MLAPWLTTAVDTQQMFLKVVTMTHEFWALMSAGSAIFLASQIAVHFAMATWLIYMGCQISYIWCGISVCKSPDVLNVSEYEELWCCMIEVGFKYSTDTIRMIVGYARWFVRWDWIMTILDYFFGHLLLHTNDESYLGIPDKYAKINRYVLNKRRRKVW